MDVSLSILGLQEFPLWRCGVAAGIAVFAGYAVWYYTQFIRSGIPGPLPLPFYANWKRSKEAFYICEQKWIEKYGKVVGFFSVAGPTLLISDVKILKQICVKEFSKFRNRGPIQFVKMDRLRNMLICLKNDQWKNVRHTIVPAFSGGKIKKMAGSLNACSDKIILETLRHSSKEGQAVEIRKLFGSYSIGCIAVAGFGLELNSQADDIWTLSAFERNAKDFFSRLKSSKWLMVGIIQDYLPTALIEHFDIGLISQASESFFFDLSLALFKKREQEDMQDIFVDFMQLMLNAHELEDEDEEPSGQRFETTKSKRVKLSVDDVVAQCVMFLVAGYETTSACLTFTAYLLACHPAVQEKLAAEIREIMQRAKVNEVTFELLNKMPYLEMVILESLRLYPPIARVTRTCNEDTVIEGIHIKKGTRIVGSSWTIHRNPDLWPEPLTFNPDRFSPENKDSVNMDAFLSFGYGPRSCIGNRFALMEIKIALARILQEFKIEIADNTPKTLELGRGVFLAPKSAVPLMFVPCT